MNEMETRERMMEEIKGGGGERNNFQVNHNHRLSLHAVPFIPISPSSLLSAIFSV